MQSLKVEIANFLIRTCKQISAIPIYYRNCSHHQDSQYGDGFFLQLYLFKTFVCFGVWKNKAIIGKMKWLPHLPPSLPKDIGSSIAIQHIHLVFWKIGTNHEDNFEINKFTIALFIQIILNKILTLKKKKTFFVFFCMYYLMNRAAHFLRIT